MTDITALYKKGLNYALFSEKRMVFKRQEDPWDKQRRLAEAQARIEEAKSEAEQEQEAKNMKEVQIPIDETRAKVVKTGMFDKDMIEGIAAERVLRARAIDRVVRLRGTDRQKYEAIVSKFFGKPETSKVRWYSPGRILRSKWDESVRIVDKYMEEAPEYQEQLNALKPMLDADGHVVHFYGTSRIADPKDPSKIVTIDWQNEDYEEIHKKLKQVHRWKEFSQLQQFRAFYHNVVNQRRSKKLFNDLLAKATKLKDSDGIPINMLDTNTFEYKDEHGNAITETVDWRKNTRDEIVQKLKKTKKWEWFKSKRLGIRFLKIKGEMEPPLTRADSDGNMLNFSGTNRLKYHDESGNLQDVTIDWAHDSVATLQEKLIKIEGYWEWFSNSEDGRKLIALKNDFYFLQDIILQELFSREASIINRAGFDGDVLLKALAKDDAKLAIRIKIGDEMQEDIRNQIKAAVENEVRQNMTSTIESEAKNDMAAEQQNHIRAEVENKIREEMQKEMVNDMHGEVEKELRANMESAIRSRLQTEVENEVREEMQGEIEERIRSELESEVRTDLERTIRSNIRAEVENKTKEEMLREMASKVREEAWSDAEFLRLLHSLGAANIDKNTIGDLNEYQQQMIEEELDRRIKDREKNELDNRKDEFDSRVHQEIEKRTQAQIDKKVYDIKLLAQTKWDQRNNEIESIVKNELLSRRNEFRTKVKSEVDQRTATILTGKTDELNRQVKYELEARKDKLAQADQQEFEARVDAEMHNRVALFLQNHAGEIDRRVEEKLKKKIEEEIGERTKAEFKARATEFEQKVNAEASKDLKEVGLTEGQKDALWKKSINYLLKRILGDDIHAKISIDDPDNHAARAALRLIVSKLGDVISRANLVDFLKTLANEPTETIEAITKLREAVSTLLQTINDGFAKRNEIQAKVDAKEKQKSILEKKLGTSENEVTNLQTQIGRGDFKDREVPIARSKIDALLKEQSSLRTEIATKEDELVTLKLEQDAPNRAIIEAVSNLGAQMREHEYWRTVLDLEDIFDDKKIKEIMSYGQNPPTFPDITKRNAFVVKFGNTFSMDHEHPDRASFEGSIHNLDDQLEERIRREQKKQLKAITSTGELSARDLLVLLHDHDFEQGGEKDETERYKKALTVANLHAAQCKTADEAIPANIGIARGLHGIEARRALRARISTIKARSIFSPSTTAETALMLLTRNEKFRFLRGISAFATPYEIQRRIDRHNEQYPDDPVTSTVLREFVAHMQKFITGINVPGLGTPKKIIDDHVRRFEGLKTTIANLSEVAFVQEIISEIPESVEGDKQKVLIDLLKRKNAERASADLEIKENLKATMDQESDVFHRYMDKQNLIDDYRAELQEAYEQSGTFWEALKEAASQVTTDELPMDKLRNYSARRLAALDAVKRTSKIPKEYRAALSGRRFLGTVKNITMSALRVPFVMGFQLAYGIHKTPGIIGTVGKWSWTKIRNGYARFVNWYNKPPS